MRTEIHRNLEDNIDKLSHLIKDIEVAMMTTTSEDGGLHSRPMATQKTDFDGDLWFFTNNRSGKILALKKDQNVNLSYASPEHNRYLSVSGRAEVVNNKQKAKELWSPVLKAWFPEGVDDPELTLIRVSVESAEYWDAPSNTLVNLVGFAKTITTGEQYRPGENNRVDLNH